MSKQEQLKCNRGDIALLVFPGKEKTFGGLEEAKSSGLPLGPAPKSAGSPVGTWWAPHASCRKVGSADTREKKQLHSASWLHNNRAVKTERRSAPLQDSAQHGFSFFGRTNSQALRTRGAPRVPRGEGTRATLLSSPRGECASLKESN